MCYQLVFYIMSAFIQAQQKLCLIKGRYKGRLGYLGEIINPNLALQEQIPSEGS